jgi:hypothetical protein
MKYLVYKWHDRALAKVHAENDDNKLFGRTLCIFMQHAGVLQRGNRIDKVS